MTFPLRIFSIDREIFVGQAKSVALPTTTGQIQILAEHAPLVSALKAGDVIIEGENDFHQSIPISGGVVEVAENEVTVLVNF